MGSRQSERYWQEREMEYLEGELAADWEELEDEKKAEQEEPCRSVDVRCERCGEIYTVEPYTPGQEYFCICGNSEVI